MCSTPSRLSPLLLRSLHSLFCVYSLELSNSSAQSGFLVAGDILVLDNAKIHFSKLIRVVLTDMLRVSGVYLVKLPKYWSYLHPLPH